MGKAKQFLLITLYVVGIFGVISIITGDPPELYTLLKIQFIEKHDKQKVDEINNYVEGYLRNSQLIFDFSDVVSKVDKPLTKLPDREIIERFGDSLLYQKLFVIAKYYDIADIPYTKNFTINIGNGGNCLRKSIEFCRYMKVIGIPCFIVGTKGKGKGGHAYNLILLDEKLFPVDTSVSPPDFFYAYNNFWNESSYQNIILICNLKKCFTNYTENQFAEILNS